MNIHSIVYEYPNRGLQKMDETWDHPTLEYHIRVSEQGETEAGHVIKMQLLVIYTPEGPVPYENELHMDGLSVRSVIHEGNKQVLRVSGFLNLMSE